MLRKLKWQIPGELLASRYNWCQGQVPGRGPAVEKHCHKRSRKKQSSNCEVSRSHSIDVGVSSPPECAGLQDLNVPRWGPEPRKRSLALPGTEVRIVQPVA